MEPPTKPITFGWKGHTVILSIFCLQAVVTQFKFKLLHHYGWQLVHMCGINIRGYILLVLERNNVVMLCFLYNSPWRSTVILLFARLCQSLHQSTQVLHYNFLTKLKDQLNHQMYNIRHLI